MNLVVSLFIFIVEVLVVTFILIFFLKRQLKAMDNLEQDFGKRNTEKIKLKMTERDSNYEIYSLEISPSEELSSSRGFVSSLKKHEALIWELDDSVNNKDKEILEQSFQEIIYKYPKNYISLSDF